MEDDSFDIVVVGAGPGGYVAAIRASQLGMKCAIVEAEHLGGICLNWGCIPTKALLRTSELYHFMKNSEKFGITVKGIDINIGKVVKRSREVSEKLSNGISLLLKKNKVTVFEGFGKLNGKNTIKVEKDGKKIVDIKAKHIIFATGARAAFIPSIEPDGKLIYDYKHAMVPKAIPKKLLVVGSGAIGLEFASFYNNLGSEVTVLELADRIIPAADKEISVLLRKSLENQSIKIHTESKIKSVKKNSKNVSIVIDHKGKEVKEDFDCIISAVGVIANSDNLGFEGTKIRTEKGNVQVDEWYKTGEEGIYAIGDLVGAPCLAHKASHEAIICVEHIAGVDCHSMKKENIPSCIYCSPQVASVGLTEEQAKEKGYEYKIGKFPYMANGKALAIAEEEGLVKTIFDSKTGELLGVHMIGAEVTEMISGFLVGKTMEAVELDFINTIFPHPTLSEAMHESVLNAFGKSIHI